MQHINWPGVHKFCKKNSSEIKVKGVRRVTRNQFHTDDPHTLFANAQHLVARDLYIPEDNCAWIGKDLEGCVRILRTVLSQSLMQGLMYKQIINRQTSCSIQQKIFEPGTSEYIFLATLRCGLGINNWIFANLWHESILHSATQNFVPSNMHILYSLQSYDHCLRSTPSICITFSIPRVRLTPNLPGRFR